MAYIGLARKWRPQTFEDLAGQGHITRTLTNAIKSERISQGYLFTGTRGVGKTSAARIFAKTIRCTQPKGPGLPCLQCTDCREIAEGRSMDVLEIDGASNNGVDAVRELRENAKYAPSSGKFKIYIIDEVHMLTTAAFNALLKILEEPPAHLIFIFATTDPQKIPATVLSRTQRFDFKRVSLKDLTDRLRHICKSEGISIAEEALVILAREAEGSFRDGISLLDQVIAVGEKEISAQTLSQALGLIDKANILRTLDGILRREPLKALDAVGEVHLYGFDLKQFGRELLRYLRQLMVLQLLEQNNAGSAAASTLLDISEADLNDLKSLIGQRSNEDLDLLFCLLNYGLEDVARSQIPKTVLDVLIVKMSSGADLVSLRDFVPQDGGAPSNSDDDSDYEPRPAKPQPSGGASNPFRMSGQAGPVPAAAHQPNNVPAQGAYAYEQAAPAAPKLQSAGLPPRQTEPAKIAAPTADALSQQNWPAFVAMVKGQKPLIGSILENASFEGFRKLEDGTGILTLGFSKEQSFYKEQLQVRPASDHLAGFMKSYVGYAVRLEYKDVLLSKSLEETEKERKTQVLRQKQRAVLESEAIRAAQEVLGARLEKLEILGEN